MDKQIRIFKLVDKKGYSNKEFLEDYGIVVDGFYYYKGRIDAEGDLMTMNGAMCLIDNLLEEFQYFIEVDSIPLAKDKPMFEEKTNTFTKSMLVSGENVVELSDGKNMLLLGDRLVDKDGWYNLSLFNENLSHNDEYDINIVSVYKMTEYFTLEDLSDTGELVLIWQRETPEQAQKRIRKKELEEKVVTLRQELKQVENELQEI